MSSKRDDIAKIVYEYKQQSKYDINYIENEENYGYDWNIRSVAKVARGEWVIYLSDDDWFAPGALDKYMDFLRKHPEVGYVLRRYREVYKNGGQQAFRYAEGDVFLNQARKPLQNYLEEVFSYQDSRSENAGLRTMIALTLTAAFCFSYIFYHVFARITGRVTAIY